MKTEDEIRKLATDAGLHLLATDAGLHLATDVNWMPIIGFEYVEKLIALAAAAERDALEAELLKLKKGIGGSSMYIQGRWDLLGEFQDIIRARGNRT
jgi:hypothetical protein